MKSLADRLTSLTQLHADIVQEQMAYDDGSPGYVALDVVRLALLDSMAKLRWATQWTTSRSSEPYSD